MLTQWIAVLVLLGILAWAVGWRLQQEMYEEFSTIWVRGMGILCEGGPATSVPPAAPAPPPDHDGEKP